MRMLNARTSGIAALTLFAAMGAHLAPAAPRPAKTAAKPKTKPKAKPAAKSKPQSVALGGGVAMPIRGGIFAEGEGDLKFSATFSRAQNTQGRSFKPFQSYSRPEGNSVLAGSSAIAQIGDRMNGGVNSFVLTTQDGPGNDNVTRSILLVVGSVGGFRPGQMVTILSPNELAPDKRNAAATCRYGAPGGPGFIEGSAASYSSVSGRLRIDSITPRSVKFTLINVLLRAVSGSRVASGSVVLNGQGSATLLSGEERDQRAREQRRQRRGQ